MRNSKKSTAELLNLYQRSYRKLGASSGSVTLVSNLWEAWESDDSRRPNLNSVAAGISKREELFFKELLVQCGRFAEQPEGYIQRCGLELYDYNFRKVSSTDGCLVVTDEAFERMLFILAVGCLHLARRTAPEPELEQLRLWLRSVVSDWFLGLKEFSMPTSGLEGWLARNYEVSEMGVFLFNAMYAFCLAHEIGHHALGHSHAETMLSLPTESPAQNIIVDAQSHSEEFEADNYALRVYQNLHLIKDGKNPLCFVWWFEFAPLLLLDICACLEVARGDEGESRTHPSPCDRKDKLLLVGELQRNDILYLDLKKIARSVII